MVLLLCYKGYFDWNCAFLISPAFTFNDTFYTPSLTGISLSYANSNYLSRQGLATSIASSTNFTGALTVGTSTVSQSGNNLNFVNGANTALTLTNASNTSSLSGYSTMAYLNPIASGVMYLTGTSGYSTGSYNLESDSLGHISFATGTNSLNLGISGSANGNLNLYGTGGTLTIPSNAGTAISCPLGSISSNGLTTTNNITLPTAGVVPTAITQLGGNSLINTFAIGTSLASGTYRIIATSPTLAVGTYLFNGVTNYVCTTAGTTILISAGFNSNTGSYASAGSQLSMSTVSNSSTLTFAAGSGSTFLSSSCVVTVTTAGVYYFNCYWSQGATSAFTVGGSASFTRIA